jgi:hypothetical protein
VRQHVGSYLPSFIAAGVMGLAASGVLLISLKASRESLINLATPAGWCGAQTLPCSTYSSKGIYAIFAILRHGSPPARDLPPRIRPWASASAVPSRFSPVFD